MDIKTRHLIIHGRVQGVFFRESMRQKAVELGISGWVRNRRDGTVEAIIQGNPENIHKITEWALKGPPGACVTQLEQSEGKGEFISFERLPSV